jgi:F0F1-type ATP synthase assembly protein I
MAQQRQSFGPGRVLAHVSLIVTLPIVGGVVAGLVADGLLATSPLFVLSGLAIGTLVTVLWLRSFIVTNAARLRSEAARGSVGDEEQRQGSAERS